MPLLSTGQFFGLAAGGGGDPFFANVVLLSGFEGGDGSTTFDDESASNKTMTAVGNAQIDTAQFKFGASSLLLDGTGDWVSLADSADWHFGTGNFTVECFVRPAALAGNNRILSQWGSSGAQGWFLGHVSSGNLRWTVSTTGSDSISEITSANGVLVVNTWHHVVVDYDGSKYRMYVDGTMVGSSSTARNLFNAGAVLAIGAFSVNSTQAWNGWIDEVRITKGVARYASDSGFTAPTAAFPRS